MDRVLPLLTAICLGTFTFAQEIRTIDGTSNNLREFAMGAVHAPAIRVTSNGYEDLTSTPGGLNRPNPRKVSNDLFAQTDLINDPLGLSDYAWAFGQFIDHDIVLIGDTNDEPFPITVPPFDAHFDPSGTGQAVIPMMRSAYVLNTGTGPENPRQYQNEITAWIDGSGVYGSDPYRAAWLRTFKNGKLKMSAGNLLPFNTKDGLFEGEIDIDAPEMAMENPFATKWFVAGDIRANENILLLSLHTLFVREHNRICEELLAANPEMEDEAIYQTARRKVGALIQAVTYEEWLPALGIQMPTYREYDPSVNANIRNVFSAAAFRYGHTTINSTIIRMDNQGNTIPEGNIRLKDAFFNPILMVEGKGIEPLLKGMGTQIQQDFDCKMIGDLRNFLFGTPGAGGLDLAAINIQRGRERGLPDYNTVRADFDMERIHSFDDLTGHPEINQIFADLYQDVNNIDPWVGMLAEDHMPNALFGETAMKIVEEQFEKLRDGDRFYYENDPAFSSEEKAQIKATRLADIIHRNTEITIQIDVFKAQPAQSTVAIKTAFDSNFELTVFPNPTFGSFRLRINSPIPGLGKVKIVNLLGQTIIHKNIQLLAAENQLHIELPVNLTKGVYQVVVQQAEAVASTRIVKQ